MIRLLDASGTAIAIPELLDRCIGLSGEARKLGWHVLTGPVTISAPQAKTRVEAVSGLERIAAHRSLDLSGKTEDSLVLELKRFWNPAERGGWLAGNTHVHLKDLTREEADRYLREVPKADGLDVVFVSYLERALVDRTYITNEHTRKDLGALSTKRLRFGNGEEYRHNFGGGGEGYGHVMFLNLLERIKPASVGPGITKQGSDGIPLRPGIEKARAQGATVVWCHNGFGFEDIPSWTAGLVDAQNIFDGGNRGSYEQTFYRYLNVGMRVPFSTGTDWFIYDFSRVYVRPRKQDGSLEDWLEGLQSARSFITNGPILELSVNGAWPGEAPVPVDRPLEIRYEAVGRHDFGTLELMVNGKPVPFDSIEHQKHDGYFKAIGNTVLNPAEPVWVAMRISPSSETTNEFGRPLFAHTSPVFVRNRGQEVFDPETAKGLIAEIESDLAEINKNGKFTDEAEQESIRKIYRNAIGSLKRRLSGKSR